MLQLQVEEALSLLLLQSTTFQQNPQNVLTYFLNEIYLILKFLQKYYTTLTFNPLRRRNTLLTLSERAVVTPQNWAQNFPG